MTQFETNCLILAGACLLLVVGETIYIKIRKFQSRREREK